MPKNKHSRQRLIAKRRRKAIKRQIVLSKRGASRRNYDGHVVQRQSINPIMQSYMRLRRSMHDTLDATLNFAR